jgi:hypothetical protein
MSYIGKLRSISFDTYREPSHYAVESTLYLIWFTNFEWVGDSTDRKSTSGYSLSLGFGLICWFRKKQYAISLSSAEEEYCWITVRGGESVIT